MKLKVYIAAPESHTDLVKETVKAVRSIGHEVISTWHVNEGEVKWVPPEFIAQCAPVAVTAAQRHWREIGEAHVLISLMEAFTPKDDPRHFIEFGILLGWARHHIIIGKPESIYHTLPWVKHASNLAEGLEQLASLAIYLEKAADSVAAPLWEGETPDA